MKRSLSLLLGLVALATVGGLYKVITNAPIQVVQDSVLCPTSNTTTEAQEIEVLGTYHWEKGVIVLYSALCPTASGKASLQRIFGHEVVKRDGLNWQVSSRDSYSINSSQGSAEKLIEYRISQSTRPTSSPQTTFRVFSSRNQSQGDRYTLVYGQILSPQVAAIEATFDNGQVVRASGDAKTFALLSANSSRICELRIFGKDNQILRKEDLAPPSRLWMPKRLVQHPTTSHQCLPYSYHL